MEYELGVRLDQLQASINFLIEELKKAEKKEKKTKEQ